MEHTRVKGAGQNECELGELSWSSIEHKIPTSTITIELFIEYFESKLGSNYWSVFAICDKYICVQLYSETILDASIEN